jgi:hypothetical protein
VNPINRRHDLGPAKPEYGLHRRHDHVDADPLATGYTVDTLLSTLGGVSHDVPWPDCLPRERYTALDIDIRRFPEVGGSNYGVTRAVRAAHRRAWLHAPG